jgi:hypothetical protein
MGAWQFKESLVDVHDVVIELDTLPQSIPLSSSVIEILLTIDSTDSTDTELPSLVAVSTDSDCDNELNESLEDSNHHISLGSPRQITNGAPQMASMASLLSVLEYQQRGSPHAHLVAHPTPAPRNM